MIKVLVFGGCVSRDAFEYDTAGEFKIAGHFARSSFASAFSSGLQEDLDYSVIESKFQRRVVRWDVEKEFPRRMKHIDYDLILVDIMSNRFDLLQRGSSVVTMSKPFKKLGIDATVAQGRIVKSWSDEYLSLWEKGFSQFYYAARSLGVSKLIRISKAYLTHVLDDGGTVSNNTPLVELDRRNAFLDKCYGFAESLLGKECFFCYEESHFIAARDHRWGIAPFHYIDEFYLHTLQQLKLAYDSTS